MTLYVLLNANNYIESYSYYKLDDRFLEVEVPDEMIGDFEWNFIHYSYSNGELRLNTEAKCKEETISNLNKELMNLKAVLAEEDYKVIKCYEAQIVGSTMPYNIHELITKRDDYRKRINEIEQTLQELLKLKHR